MTELDREGRLLLLHAALDGELDAAGALEMERMIAADKELADEYARLVALRKAVREQTPRATAPQSLRARVLSSIEDKDASAGESAPAKSSRVSSNWRQLAAAVAATAVVTLGLQHVVSTMNAPNLMMQSIVSAHMRSQISGQPVDVVSSDRHTVKPWLASKLPVAAVVVDLASEGFPLLGGRVDIVAGAAAPTLVYRRREHLISVTELRGDKGRFPETPKLRSLQGYPVVTWSDGQRDFVAISDLAPSELDAFVAAFREAARKEASEPPSSTK